MKSPRTRSKLACLWEQFSPCNNTCEGCRSLCNNTSDKERIGRQGRARYHLVFQTPQNSAHRNCPIWSLLFSSPPFTLHLVLQDGPVKGSAGDPQQWISPVYSTSEILGFRLACGQLGYSQYSTPDIRSPEFVARLIGPSPDQP